MNDIIKPLQELFVFLNAWGFTATELVSLVTSLSVVIDLLFRGQKAQLKKYIQAESEKAAAATVSNAQRLQMVVDAMQARFVILRAIPDQFLINLITEVYQLRVKHRVDTGAIKDEAG